MDLDKSIILADMGTLHHFAEKGRIFVRRIVGLVMVMIMLMSFGTIGYAETLGSSDFGNLYSEYSDVRDIILAEIEMTPGMDIEFSLNAEELWCRELLSSIEGASDEDLLFLCKLMAIRNREASFIRQNILTLEMCDYLLETLGLDSTPVIDGTDLRLRATYVQNRLEAEQLYQDYLGILTDWKLGEDALPLAEGYRAAYFASKVRSGGDWDLKIPLGVNTKYSFLYQLRDGEYIGNHHYGYMGTVAGYSSFVLRVAAGAYQVWSGTSHWEFMSSYFDDPNDQIAINDGIRDVNIDFGEGVFW